ncbi:molybdenum cofactor biosynthesis protein B [Jannaschia sp. R86511]|uniref:MogA/MoaB family molybdenum cofactor biosynthesis protein n=1 Tax=Jannaschia sp. R86511 TaxID=3093853 RepID=UPI0036D27B3B
MTGSATDPGATPAVVDRARVVTVSTSAAAGRAEDRSGPLLVAGLRERGWQVPDPLVVADGDPVAEALRRCLADDVAVVLLTGGTGLTADDTTPEQVLPLLDRLVPGIPEALRADGTRRGVATSALSRGVAGVAGSTLVVTLPGSTGACRDALELLGPLLPHAAAMLGGAPAHGHGRGEGTVAPPGPHDA